MDPSQRKLLEVVYEAFENGGETWDTISGSRTGVYVGNFSLDHLLMQARDWENPKPYSATGADSSILANRISYVFDLRGPSLTTTTACSSSMYALHLAVQAIRNGECDSAIVAASNCILDPTMSMVLDKLGALSPTSRCHTFDASADGYARGEGYAALYLKKASLALLDGSPIRAVIRGTAVNANGRTAGIARPQADGQEAVIRQAYANAGNLPFSDTAFFECHGTGTQAGDPIEVSAVGNVFSSSRSDDPEDRLLIGAVKTNLGHTEGASAIASVMKIVLSLEAGEIPPTFGVKELNPAIDFDSAKVHVVTDGPVAWPQGRLRRASVNSFGFGGANGHCIIDHVNVVFPHYRKPGVVKGCVNGINGVSSHVNGHVEGQRIGNSLGQGAKPGHPHLFSPGSKTATVDAETREFVVLPLSAHNTTSLELNVNALSQMIGQSSLADVAFTLASKRSRFQYRSFRIVTRDKPANDLIPDNGAVFTSPKQPARVGFVFTGQGAQWPAMGAQLFEYAVFRNTISYLDTVLGAVDPQRGWTIREILEGQCEEGRVQSPEVSQPACTAVQIGLVELLTSWSIRPSAVVGHSSGEMAAAYASGHVTAAEAIAAAYVRGHIVSRNKRNGAMLAVGLGAEDIFQYIREHKEKVNVAAFNSPRSVTISGDVDAVEAVAARLNGDGVFNRALRSGGTAYHSHHMASLGAEFVKMLSDALKRISHLEFLEKRPRYARGPWMSSVIPGKAVWDHIIPVSYWRDNLESPVLFSGAISKMLGSDTKTDVLIEIGPHPALKGPVDQVSKSMGKTVPYLSSLERGQDARVSLLKLAGSLFGLNAEIDLVAVNAVDGDKGGLVHGCTALDLPAYQYAYGPVKYYECRASKEWRLRHVLRHDLLGARTPGTSKFQPQWRNVLKVKDVPWLQDHRLLPNVSFSVTGFIAMATEAASQAHHGLPDALSIKGYHIRDLEIKAGLPIPEDDSGVEVVTCLSLLDSATSGSPSWSSFTISSVTSDSEAWLEHCTGYVRVEVAESTARKRLSTESTDPRFPDPRSWYRRFVALGIGHGPAFQTLSDLRIDSNSHVAAAQVSLKSADGIVPGGESEYALHPTAIDGALQLGLIAGYGGQVEQATTAFVPIRFGEVYLKAGINQDTAAAVAHAKSHGPKGITMQLQMVDKTGQVFFDCAKVSFVAHGSSKKTLDKSFSAPFTRLAWKPDFRALDNEKLRGLFPPPEENMRRISSLERADMIVCLVIADVYDAYVIPGGPQPSGELRHWLEWLKRTVEKDKRENMTQVRHMSTRHRHHLLQRLYGEAGNDPEAIAAKIVHENIRDILQGRKTALDLLVPGGLLTSMYQEGHMLVGAYPQLFNVMDCLSHAMPNLRIIEIGAGTGGATRVALKALTGPNGIKRYSDYTFTDISAGFLTSAQSSLASRFPDMKFSVLNIEIDPSEQGYEPVYDVVVASQSIHATASMSLTLANCRRLLKPGGKLIVVETTRMRVLPGLIYGVMTGYWLGINDGRSEGPFMELEVWDSKLRGAGFSGAELHLNDYPSPHNTTSVIVSTLQQHNLTNGHAPKPEETVHLLHGSGSTPKLLCQVAMEFRRRGIVPAVSRIDVDDVRADVAMNSRVVAFLDGSNLLLDADEDQLRVFQHLASHSKSMLWLTCTGIIEGRSADGALVTGLLRTIHTENPAGRFLSIDIDSEDFDLQTDDSALVRQIVDREIGLQEQEPDAGAGAGEDRELAWHDGCMWVSRVVPDGELDTYAETSKTPQNCGYDMLPLASQGPVSSAFGVPGVFGSLYYRPTDEGMQQPLQGGHIEIKVGAAGLNLRDLDIMSGKLSAEESSSLLCEYAGIVTKIGANVTDLSVGDRVYGVTVCSAGRGYFDTYVHASAALTRKLGPRDCIEEVVTIPLAYMTALFALTYTTRIRKGQKALIHVGPGPLGLALVHLARALMVEVFVTVDTREEADILANHTATPVSHILLRGDQEAISRVAGNSHGFDVILNTVPGESLSHSLDGLARVGHLIDLTGRDVINPSHLRKNVSFSSIDINDLLRSDPSTCGRLFLTIGDLYRDGSIQSLRPVSIIDISNLGQVESHIMKKRPIGKAVVTFQNPDSKIKVLRTPFAVAFDHEATYVITGGLGGLGRCIIRWMASRGAKHFLVLSRRGIASSEEARSLEKGMRAVGVSIRCEACDVSDKGKMISIIHGASAQRLVKGVIHAALSLSDISFDKLTLEQWQEGISAKVSGTKNLHEATLDMPLDFFIMITSTESIWAPPTQSTYMAASSFQDSFARFRRRLGLPATSIAYGLVDDVSSDWRHGSSGTDAIQAKEYESLSYLDRPWIGNWYRHDPLSAANIFTCMDPSAMAAKQRHDTTTGASTTLIPRWYGDGRVSLIMRALNDAQRFTDGLTGDGTGSDSDVEGASSVARVRSQFEQLMNPSPREVEKVVGFVVDAITKAVAEMLFIDVVSINPANSVAGHGVDSLIAAELRSWFHQALGHGSIKTQELLDTGKSITQLARTVVEAV
uniref:Polyketide synthase 17 n=1 Tax=Diaporthe helianthi TaxID=158607 RepID=A0A1I9KI77_DIAHE|nr:polyketide synthase 17 [Diaporthe helianthi]